MAQLDFAYNTLDAENDQLDFGTFAPLNDREAGKSAYDMNSILMSRENEVKKKNNSPPVIATQPRQSPLESLIPKGIPTGIPKHHEASPPPKKTSTQTYGYDVESFNRQFEEQQMANAYMRQVQMQQQQVYQGPSPPLTPQAEPGYFEKLFSKKKEFFKLIQWVLIVVLAVSVHFFIDHYIKNYLSTNDLSTEREFFLRALYPTAVLFLLWNLRVFSSKP